MRDLGHYTLSPETGLFSTWESNSRFEFSSLVTILAVFTSKITTTIKTIATVEHTSEGRQPYWDERHVGAKSMQSVFTCTSSHLGSYCSHQTTSQHREKQSSQNEVMGMLKNTDLRNLNQHLRMLYSCSSVL